MATLDKTYLIKWYGPLKSVNEVKDWEQKQYCAFNLYLIYGQKKYSKTSEHYYIGKTIQGVYKRFNNK